MKQQNLDIENENKIIHEINLNNKNRTVIIISHRKTQLNFVIIFFNEKWHNKRIRKL